MPLFKIPCRLLTLLVASLSLGPSFASADNLLTPAAPLNLSGTRGKFDFLAIDVTRRRLLAAHTGNASLDVIDLDQTKLVKSVPTGAAQDCAVDEKSGQYLVSVSKPPQLAMVDAEKLEVTGRVPLAGPADLLAFHPGSNRAYVCHDDGKELWIVDPASGKVTASVSLPADAPEDLAFDASGKRLFQAIKSASTMAVIDVGTNAITAAWPTVPALAPHGIALVPEADAIAVSGGNGKLVLMSQEGGGILASGDIPLKVDQIAYDSARHRIYCASGLGKIAVFSVEKRGLKKLGEVSTSEGARSIALDSKTHSVWIAYVKGDQCFVQEFKSGAPHLSD